MPPEITRLAKQFQKDPLRIEVSKPATTASTIKQYVTHCPSNEDTVKRAVLRSIIKARSTDQGIVFCNRKTEVDIVAKSLASHGFDAAPIHGDLPQSQRTATLDRFRNKELKLLVASDVAARGLDIPEVSQVFNYAPPPNSDDYVHRIGRTGRAGRSGESFTIVSPGDARLWDAVAKRISKDVEIFVPEGMDDAVGDARSRGPATGRDRFDRKRGRGGRGRGPDREERSEAPAAPAAVEAEHVAVPVVTFEALEVVAEPPARTEDHAQPERSGRRDRKRGRDRDSRPRESGGQPNRESSRNRHGERQPGEGQGGDDNFKGMGDHVPAFLLRTLGKRQDA
jgi:superfamily II DNA/RNA helicase